MYRRLPNWKYITFTTWLLTNHSLDIYSLIGKKVSKDVLLVCSTKYLTYMPFNETRFAVMRDTVTAYLWLTFGWNVCRRGWFLALTVFFRAKCDLTGGVASPKVLWGQIFGPQASSSVLFGTPPLGGIPPWLRLWIRRFDAVRECFVLVFVSFLLVAMIKMVRWCSFDRLLTVMRVSDIKKCR